MANVPLSDLTALPSTDLATGDLLYIVDVSEALDADKSKKITLASLFSWQSWTPTISYGGGSTNPTSATLDYARYLKIGSIVFALAKYDIVRGTGDRTITNISLPVTSSRSAVALVGNASLVGSTVTNYPTYFTNVLTIRMLHGTMTSDGYVSVMAVYESA